MVFPEAVRPCGTALRLFAVVAAIVVVGATRVAAESTPKAAPSIKEHPADDAVGYLRVLGEEALANERYGDAIRLFSEILRHDWNNPHAFSLLQEARVQRKAALSRWESQGRRARAEKRWGAAIRLFGQVLDEDSTRADLRLAIRDLEVREDVDRLVRAGLTRFVDEDFAGAQLDFEQALALEPGDSTAARYLDLASGQLARSTSLADLQADSAVWTKYRTALLKFRAGDFGEARRLWTEILTAYPGNEHVRSNLEQIARRLGREPVVTSE